MSWSLTAWACSFVTLGGLRDFSFSRNKRQRAGRGLFYFGEGLATRVLLSQLCIYVRMYICIMKWRSWEFPGDICQPIWGGKEVELTFWKTCKHRWTKLENRVNLCYHCEGCIFMTFWNFGTSQTVNRN